MSKPAPRSVARSRLVLLLTAVLLAFFVLALQMFRARTVQAVSTGIVISQVYGGAGCSTAGCSTYKNDYIELFNRGSSPISLNGWSVQYASATGTTWQVTSLTNFTLQPGQYYLVQEGSGANGVNNIPAPDATGTIAMSATVAKVALVDNTSPLSGSCPSIASIVDLIGYGSTASCFETAVAPAPSTTIADIRNGGGCVETDNNSTDFAAAAPTPRNTASATNSCPTPSPTPTPTPGVPGSVVISQIYGGGGNSGATYKNDFIEIFNRSSSTIDLSGWSVQYASAAATSAWVKTPLTGLLAPGQYYLIQEAAGTGGSVDLPTPDIAGTIAMSATKAN